MEVQLLEKERDLETLAYKHPHNRVARGTPIHAAKMRLCKALLVLATLTSVVSSAAVIQRDEGGGGGKMPHPASLKVARWEPEDTKHFREFFFRDPVFLPLGY